MTYRHHSRRPVLPVLTALLVGATTAGAATVLARPMDALAGERTDVAASFTQVQWPGGAARPNASRPTSPAPSPPSTQPAPTTTTRPRSSTPAPPPTTSTRPPTTTAPTSNPGPPPPAPIDRVVELVNQARVENGCDPVTVDARLTTAASGHSEDMSKRDYFAHTSPEGKTFDERIEEAGYPAPGAENIARGQQTAEAVMDAWMKSKGHRANIINCQLTTIGVGLDPDGWYWTQDFGY